VMVGVIALSAGAMQLIRGVFFWPNSV